jgi:ketosteroid isomerase-like protein
MKRLLVLSCLVLMTLTFACQTQTQSPPDNRAANEAALRKADEAWSKAAGSKDVDKTVSFYADDATVMPPNAAVVTEKDAIRKIWKDYLTAPGFSGGWKATKVEVARSGEIGYVIGTWVFTTNDASGKPATDQGKFTEVWKKQADGSWKCVADIWNSDLPLPAPTEKK